jgi:hypothetical protein
MWHTVVVIWHLGTRKSKGYGFILETKGYGLAKSTLSTEIDATAGIKRWRRWAMWSNMLH